MAINVYINSNYISEILSKDYYFQNTSPYYGSLITKDKEKEIEQIIDYIQEQNKKGIDVKIVSYYSNLYMNILKRNNGDFDLPFYGNMGKDGEDGMIGKISKLKKTKILILTEEDNVYQESKKVMNYIKSNLKFEGTIQQFSIYMGQ